MGCYLPIATASLSLPASTLLSHHRPKSVEDIIGSAQYFRNRPCSEDRETASREHSVLRCNPRPLSIMFLLSPSYSDTTRQGTRCRSSEGNLGQKRDFSRTYSIIFTEAITPILFFHPFKKFASST
jgi:hypothetical protein